MWHLLIGKGIAVTHFRISEKSGSSTIRADTLLATSPWGIANMLFFLAYMCVGTYSRFCWNSSPHMWYSFWLLTQIQVLIHVDLPWRKYMEVSCPFGCCITLSNSPHCWVDFRLGWQNPTNSISTGQQCLPTIFGVVLPVLTIIHRREGTYIKCISQGFPTLGKFPLDQIENKKETLVGLGAPAFAYPAAAHASPPSVGVTTPPRCCDAVWANIQPWLGVRGRPDTMAGCFGVVLSTHPGLWVGFLLRFLQESFGI